MKTREQLIASLRRQVAAQWAVIVILAALLVAVLTMKAFAAPEKPELLPEAAARDTSSAAAIASAISDTTAEASVIETEATMRPISEDRPAAKSLGEFKLYAYCPCEKCCGIWADGITASGAKAVQGRTIAVDPAVIPLGSLVIIDGVSYVAEDTGAGIEGNTVDIYFDSHAQALEFGVRYSEVWLVED